MEIAIKMKYMVGANFSGLSCNVNVPANRTGRMDAGHVCGAANSTKAVMEKR